MRVVIVASMPTFAYLMAYASGQIVDGYDTYRFHIMTLGFLTLCGRFIVVAAQFETGATQQRAQLSGVMIVSCPSFKSVTSIL